MRCRRRSDKHFVCVWYATLHKYIESSYPGIGFEELLIDTVLLPKFLQLRFPLGRICPHVKFRYWKVHCVLIWTCNINKDSEPLRMWQAAICSRLSL